MPNFADITKLITEKWELLAAIAVIFSAGIAGLVKWQQDRQRRSRIRQIPAGDFPFEVIKPRSPDLLKQIMGGDEKNPLADYKIPYQERQPDRAVCQELEQAFVEKNWVLILGKSGLGKTREAAHLADVLNQEGWTVLKLDDQPGEWLDVPKGFPSKISKDDKLLFFLDDLNRWMDASNPNQIHPKAGEDLARPLREPMQERLPRLLDYFEAQCKLNHVRVIATARDEREPDKPGKPTPWQKLQWEKYKAFWGEFKPYLLVEPSPVALVKLLTDCVAVAGLDGVPAEYEQIARRNDGTFRNMTANLDGAYSQGLAVNDQQFSPRLDQTWRQKYNRAVQRYPLVAHGYDAVELLSSLNLSLTAPMLKATAKLLLPGRGLRRWWQGWHLRPALRYLVTIEHILKPKDGQIEAKKTEAVDVGRYLPSLLRLLGQMASQDPTYPVAAESFACGYALGQLGQTEDAIASYDQVLKYKPDEHAAWFSRGNALGQLGRTEEAIASYDRALHFKPDDYPAWYNRSIALGRLGRTEEAIASYDRTLQFSPDSHAAWFNRGNALGELRRTEEAIASYDRALHFKPDKHAAWFNRGVALGELGRTEEAIASFDQALQIKPDKHEAWFSRGNALGRLGRTEEAIASYDRALHFKPDDYPAWFNRGVALGELGRTEEAIASFDQALQIKPDKHEAWFSRGNALGRLGRTEEAIASYDRALHFKPDDYPAWFNRGVALKQLGRIDEAIASYDWALQFKPDSHEAWYNRGITLGELGRTDEAIASYDRALQFKPDDPAAWNNRGITLGELGRIKDAIASFDRALQIKPDDPAAWYNKARCHGLEGNVELAIDNLQHALQLAPNKCYEMVATDTNFDSIRSDPRFQALLNGSDRFPLRKS
ncbi:tetratricopeptide repeat protein [Leptolyngbya sp. Cla-17]|uniref:tetratricopeptide repeat protein n=1 Tax=Leptolyngbya sp. Cla-17 TaxID=2803751 RepID=UPI0018D929D0|nr:tetratricopeptide repeat protein [Leptolyngbya sp. Cla-17]